MKNEGSHAGPGCFEATPGVFPKLLIFDPTISTIYEAPMSLIQPLKKSFLFVILALLAPLAELSQADEGMWLFNELPTAYLKAKYGFEPTPEWSEHLMKASVRFNVGGSASFISSNGLVLTNHHVGSDTLYKLSTKDRDLYRDGFLARSLDEELKAPDLELNQLVNIKDVTAEVNAAVDPSLNAAAANLARRAAIEKIEKAATEASELRSNVITLYGGGRYHLYQFKRYTDVRLVWSPESAIAFFGGDADNFEYPRFCLDACIFRVYENDQPAKIEHFLKWSANGPVDGELTFVSGNPGRTSRIFSVDALEFTRDVRLPLTMDILRRREVLLQQYSLNGGEQARQAKEDLFGIQNSRKARNGMLQGLQDPASIDSKLAAEKQLRDALASKPELAKLASGWDEVAAVNQERAKLIGKNLQFNSQLFGFAQTLVQMAAEDQKASSERLREYQDAGRESLKLQLFSDAPIYKDLEQTLTADSISLMLEKRGAKDSICGLILDGKSPQQRAAELVTGTKLDDPAIRKALAEGGLTAIKDSTDPMIQLATLLDEHFRAERKLTEELDERERQAYAKIAEAKFAIQGTGVYPDATFSLRLAFGPVKGYEQDGVQIPSMTTLDGAFQHETAHAGQADFKLPPSWHEARDANKIELDVPFNFVNTADIIGGNSGSPVVNKNLELVGLIFDGNIQSLTADFVYDERQGRAVSVHSEAIRHAIRNIYGASELADQLGN
jgi:hypothetical protein